MIRHLQCAALSMGLVAACTTIDPPRPRGDGAPIDAGDEASEIPPYARCRRLKPQFDANLPVWLYDVGDGAETLCVSTATFTEDAARAGAVLSFCVAGDLARVAVPSVIELEGINADLRTCAYCTVAYADCRLSGGISTQCDGAYAVVGGRARIVRLGRTPGEAVWIDVGALEVARIVRRNGLEVLEVDSEDCLFVDSLTMQGVLERGTIPACSGIQEPVCEIAKSAASRTP
jgi:hypothetical protein